MAMMDAYGHCTYCHGEGALWKNKVWRRYFFWPWKKRLVTVYLCDECDPPVQKPTASPYDLAGKKEFPGE